MTNTNHEHSQAWKTVADTWNKRVRELVLKEYYSQRVFAAIYKVRYKVGNQADVSRWLNVGSDTSKGKIGFPSYDTMKRIADLLGVTVGYLTGETDHKSFDMGQVCSHLGIDEATGNVIKSIAKQNKPLWNRCINGNTGAALQYLITASNFKAFINALCALADAVYKCRLPTTNFEKACEAISPEIREMAVFYHKENYIEEMGDVIEGATPELWDAVRSLDRAEQQDSKEKWEREKTVKLEKYELQEIFIKLIDEIMTDDHVEEMKCYTGNTINGVSYSDDELWKMLEKERDDYNEAQDAAKFL